MQSVKLEGKKGRGAVVSFSDVRRGNFILLGAKKNNPIGCMLAHSSDMQDPSPHTIPRHLQTVYHHYLLTNTPLFLAALHRTHSRIQALHWHYSLCSPHQLPCFGYIGRLLSQYSSIPTTLFRHRHCSWRDSIAQPLAIDHAPSIPSIQLYSRRATQTDRPLSILRNRIPRTWRKLSVGGSLQGLARESAARSRCRTPGAQFIFSVSQ
jgi:hypothetical protein